MEKKEFIDTLTEIGTCEDETRRRDLLATLNTEASTLFDNNATLTTQNASLTSDNENLRAANMKLFLQVGQQKDTAEKMKDTTGIQQEQPAKKKSFNDLFDEKGGLK